MTVVDEVFMSLSRSLIIVLAVSWRMNKAHCTKVIPSIGLDLRPSHHAPSTTDQSSCSEVPAFSPSTLLCAIFTQCSTTATSRTMMHCGVVLPLWRQRTIYNDGCAHCQPPNNTRIRSLAMSTICSSQGHQLARSSAHRTSKESAGQTRTIQYNTTKNSTNVESQLLQRSQHQDGQLVLQLGKFVHRDAHEFYHPVARLEGGRLLLLVSQLPERDHP